MDNASSDPPVTLITGDGRPPRDKAEGQKWKSEVRINNLLHPEVGRLLDCALPHPPTQVMKKRRPKEQENKAAPPNAGKAHCQITEPRRMLQE